MTKRFNLRLLVTPKFLVLYLIGLILAAPLVSTAQMQQILRTSVPQRNSDEYWSVVDEFADTTIHLSTAKHFLEMHGGLLTDRQCAEYSKYAVGYDSRLAMLEQNGIAANDAFWSDLRTYSSQMIGQPGVPIPGHRVSTYSITTGSKPEDDDLRRLVSWQLDEAMKAARQPGSDRSSEPPQACRAPGALDNK